MSVLAATACAAGDSTAGKGRAARSIEEAQPVMGPLRTRKSLPPMDMRAVLDATDVEHAIVAGGACS